MKRLYISFIVTLLAAGSMSMAAQEKADTLESSATRGLTVKAEQLDARMMGNVRNMLTGEIPGLWVAETAGGLWNSGNYETFHVNSDQVTLRYRGYNNMTCIVDGIVLPFNAYDFDLSQIESIELIGDIVDKTKFGPMASNGAISITTKNGGWNEPMKIKVTAEYGIATPGIVAEFVDGVDYAILNNQARANAGYPQLYSPLAIEGYLRGDAYDLQYPNVDYRNLILGDMMPVGNASVSITGGSDRVKYAATISETYQGDIVKTDVPQDFNKINISTNVTSKINRYLTVNAGFNSSLSFRRQGRVYWYDWQNLPPIAYPVILGTNEGEDVGDDLAGMTIYGTTATWTGNYYALLAEGGFSTRRLRSGMMYANLTFDFGEWIPGLKSDTYIGYSTFMATTVSKSNDYLSYYWDATAENGMGVISPSHQGVKASGKSISSTGANQFLQLKERLHWDWSKAGHNINLGGSFLMYDASLQGVGYYRRLAQAIADAKYNYDNRYVIEGAFQYVGSSRFDWDSRFKPFGSVGAAWVVSNEPFMKNVSWIDKLKIRGQFGTTGDYSSAFGTEYMYQSSYTRANGYKYGPTLDLPTWFGNKQWTSQKTTVTQLANPDLTWEYTTSWSAGLDFDFCKGFSLDLNAFGYTTHGGIEEVSSAVPTIYGIGATSVYANYTSNTYIGYEATLGYRHDWKDFGIDASASIFHHQGKYNILVTDDYLYEYQKKTGTDINSTWGLECIGKYETQEQLETVPSYSAVQLGDLMYKDQNGDGVIDTNDRVIIGNGNPQFRLWVNLGFHYKNFEFLAVGSGLFNYDSSCTGSYFWSGWGDGLYSAFVRDNIGGDYPRLSYVKSTNNFVASTFWLRDETWFKIQEVSLGYNVPIKNDKVVKGLKFYVKGSNLATFTNFEYLDPEANSAGLSSYPLFRMVTASAKINF